MRTRSVHFVILLSTMLLLSAFASAQTAERQFPGPCFYGCGPYVPLVTTPSVTLTTVSPSPVGASNATTGLVAGATNSTLSEVAGNQSSVYTVPVWYAGGGTPLIAPAVNSPVGGMHMMHEGNRPPMHPEMHAEREGAREVWIYYSGANELPGGAQVAGAARGARHASKTYSNQDVERQNEQNGTVRHGGKTEKL